MRCCSITLLCAGLFFSTGCAEKEAPKAKTGSGIEIHVPGVDIKLNPQDGLEVKAPGTEVRAKKGEGVEVKAPGTEVRASKDNGVEVKAPGVDVDVEPKKSE